LFRDLPRRARWYVGSVIALGTATLIFLDPLASYAPIPSLAFLILLSSLTAAYKVQFPIASGSNMSVSYVVDIAVLIPRSAPAMFVEQSARGASRVGTRRRNRRIAPVQHGVPHHDVQRRQVSAARGTPHITPLRRGRSAWR
jgi:hypothetical protein